VGPILDNINGKNGDYRNTLFRAGYGTGNETMIVGKNLK
jgi:hypothetical protein